MEENQVKTKKFSLQYGLLAGLVGVVFGVMLFAIDLHYERGLAIQLVQFGILGVFVVIGILQFKKANGTYLILKDALKIGAGVGLIAAVIGTVWFLIMSNVLEPDYLDKTYEIAKVQAFEDNPRLTQEQWDQGVAFQKKLFPIFLAVGLIISALFGLIVGLVTGLIAKKDKASY